MAEHDWQSLRKNSRMSRRAAVRAIVGAGTLASLAYVSRASSRETPAGRKPVVFWHFWGGAEQQTVREVVARFNASQQRHWVHEVAVPGQNLDMKLFMATAGGAVPDVVNQDDQVVAQWAARGLVTPLRELVAKPTEYNDLLAWLTPAARRIGTYDDTLIALCNALDIRAMFYRTAALRGGPVPTTIPEFDALAKRRSTDPRTMPYLPDDRRLWAWAIAFGGGFANAAGKLTVAGERNVAALEWMASYTRFHGLNAVQAFRSTNREAGAGSMLLAGRYEIMMDGQWRVAELDRAGLDYEVGPLPVPSGGREEAGWVNGNFFLVPRAAANPSGAWAFMRFWSGFGHEDEAARTAAAGGWIPASSQVYRRPVFQEFLDRHPNFRQFVTLAGSENQVPTPAVPAQQFLFDRVNRATEEALGLSRPPREALEAAAADVTARTRAEET